MSDQDQPESGRPVLRDPLASERIMDPRPLPQIQTYSPGSLRATASPLYCQTIWAATDQRVPAQSTSEDSSAISSEAEERQPKAFRRFYMDQADESRDVDNPVSVCAKPEPTDPPRASDNITVKKEPEEPFPTIQNTSASPAGQESAASRVRRELSADFDYNSQGSPSSSLSKLEKLVKNISSSTSPAVSQQSVFPPTSPWEFAKTVPIIKPKPRRLRDQMSPSSPTGSPVVPTTAGNPHLQELQRLAERYRGCASTPSGGSTLTVPPGAMSWSSPWSPAASMTTPPGLPHTHSGLPSYPGLGSWPLSPHMALPMFMGMPYPGYHGYPPSLPYPAGMPLFPGIPLPSTPGSTYKHYKEDFKKEDLCKSQNLAPLDLSGPKKRTESETSASDLASPLSDNSSPGDVSRVKTEQPLNLAKKFRGDHRNAANFTSPVSVPKMPSVPLGLGFNSASPMGLHPALGGAPAGFLPPSLYSHPSPSTFPASSTKGISPSSASSVSPLSGDDQESCKKKRKFLDASAVVVLSDWYEANREHPYPDEEMVEGLAERANITESQVKKWMANKRVRSCNTLTHNGSIHPKKLQKLMQIKEGVAKALAVNNMSPVKAEPVAMTSPADGAKSKRSKGNRFLNPKAVLVMSTWYQDHLEYPYPTEAEKHSLAQEAGITVSQVTCWFANKRNRSNNTKKLSTKMMWQHIHQKKRALDSLEHEMERKVFDNKHLTPLAGSIDV